MKEYMSKKDIRHYSSILVVLDFYNNTITD